MCLNLNHCLCSKQLDVAARGLAIEFLQVMPLTLEQSVVADHLELLDAQFTGIGHVLDLAWINISQILVRDGEALTVDVPAHELDITRPDVDADAAEHLAAPDQLELKTVALAAQFQDVVDQPLHRYVAIARGSADLPAPAAASLGGIQRQHEMIHAAYPQAPVAYAGRDA